jgi:VanZ family protein
VSRRLRYLALLFVLAGLLLFVPLPISPTYFGRTIENAGHTPLFVMLTLGMLFVLRTDPRFTGARLYALVALVGVGTGFVSEIIQRPLARDASWEDVVADALGVVLGLAVYAIFDRRAPLRRWHRVTAFGVALICIAIFMVPIVRMTRAYVHRNGQFPVLADFRSRLELYWTVSFGVTRDIVYGVLEVEFGTGEFPGVSFHEPVPDWRGYQTLLIEVENPDSTPLELAVRVHDRAHTRAFADRFNRRFQLDAGERRTLRIPLEDIRNGPRQRLMDMAHISDITLFKGAVSGSNRLFIYSLKLE